MLANLSIKRQELFMSGSWRLDHLLLPPFKDDHRTYLDHQWLRSSLVLCLRTIQNDIFDQYLFQVKLHLSFFVLCKYYTNAKQTKNAHLPFRWLNCTLILVILSASFSKLASPSWAFNARTFQFQIFTIIGDWQQLLNMGLYPRMDGEGFFFTGRGTYCVLARVILLGSYSA